MKRRVSILARGGCLLLACCMLGVSWGQNMGTGQQLPVGQTFKNFEFPVYQDGKLKAKFIAVEARGITQNRAETSNLTIRVYDKDVETTTITSPKADLYVNERKMRTKNTVLIVRPTQEVSAQICDFDLINKKYMLRTKVRVVLKNVNLSNSPAPTPAPAAAPEPAPAPVSAPTPPPASDELPQPTMETPISTLPPVPTTHPSK